MGIKFVALNKCIGLLLALSVCPLDELTSISCELHFPFYSAMLSGSSDLETIVSNIHKIVRNEKYSAKSSDLLRFFVVPLPCH